MNPYESPRICDGWSGPESAAIARSAIRARISRLARRAILILVVPIGLALGLRLLLPDGLWLVCGAATSTVAVHLVIALWSDRPERRRLMMVNYAGVVFVGSAWILGLV